MPLTPGTTIGRYRIESRLGGGAMGVVYLALDTHLERRVALKLIAPTLAADPDFRSRFEREARAAAALDHPNVLPVYEAGEDDGQLYLAMRYVPGVDLATQLARHGPLDLPTTTRLVEQLAAALDAAHARGLVHRDVKPANVLLGPGDHAYLADFGLARSASGSGITRPGQLVGTADYTAPELLRGANASPASDTYALACLAVECLTGEPPFGRGDEMATLYAHAHDPVPPLIEQRPELPAGLQAVVERGLAKDPADRYPTAGELARALGATFVPVGRRRLKGLNEPIQLFRVIGPDAPAARARPRLAFPMVAAIGLVAAVAIALIAIRTWIGATESGLGASTEPSASPSASPLASLVSAVASASDLAFPQGDEQGLVALIPEPERDRCVRASPADTPELREAVIAGVPARTYVNRRLMAVNAGIECALGGIAAPDTVWFWELQDASEAVQWIAQQAGVLDAPSGSCSAATPVVEEWEFGESSGRLLCYTTGTGDAVLIWNYDGGNLMGRAVRDDQDMAAALRWWSEEARFLSDSP